MNYLAEKRAKRLLEFHLDESKNFPSKLSLELGLDHMDALERLCILLDSNKTATIRFLIDFYINDQFPPGLVVESPGQLLQHIQTHNQSVREAGI
jgi:hypothetical protein